MPRSCRSQAKRAGQTLVRVRGAPRTGKPYMVCVASSQTVCFRYAVRLVARGTHKDSCTEESRTPGVAACRNLISRVADHLSWAKVWGVQTAQGFVACTCARRLCCIWPRTTDKARVGPSTQRRQFKKILCARMVHVGKVNAGTKVRSALDHFNVIVDETGGTWRMCVCRRRRYRHGLNKR